MGKEDEIEAKRNQFLSKKGWMTRRINKVKEVLNKEPYDQLEAKLRIDMMNKTYDELMKLFDDLCAFRNDAEEDKFNEEADRLEETETAIFNLRKQFEEMSLHVSMRESTPIPSSTISNSSKVKLPKLECPRFDGDPLKYMEFKENLEITVLCSSSGLDDVAKFLYLRSLLDGDAKKLISGLPAVGSNLSVALSLLEERYGRVDELKDHLMDKLYEIPESTDQENIETVKRRIDDINMIVGQLKGLEVKVEEELSPVLVPMLRDKLPSSWKMEWFRKSKENKSKKFKDLQDFMNDEIRIRESCANKVEEKRVVSSASCLQVVQHKVEDKDNKNKSSLVREEKMDVKCTFCNGSHYPSKCEAKMSVHERRKKVYDKKACFKCGMIGHSARTCNYHSTCKFCGGPKSNHITQLCQNKKPEKPSPSHGGRYLNSANNVMLMRTLSLDVCSASDTKLKPIRIRALCDTGCTYTTISKSLATKLKAKTTGTYILKIDTYGSSEGIAGKYEGTTLYLHGVNGSAEKRKVNVLIGAPVLGGKLDTVPNDLRRKIEKAGYTPLGDGCQDSSFDMMIGEDLYDTFIIGETEKFDENMKVTPTVFGWMVHGGSGLDKSSGSSYTFTAQAYRCGARLEDFWEVEHLGVTPSDIETKPVAEKVESTLYRDEEGRYHVSWPWKEGLKTQVSDNRNAALSRLRRMVQRCGEVDKVHNEIERLLDEGHIEMVPENELKTEGLVSYLPHRPIIKEEKSTSKVRIVFDGSCRSGGGLSLNQCLEVGENLLPGMFGILLRFRLKEVVLCGDLRSAFLMMSLKEKEDKDVCRFFWIDRKDPHSIIEYRLTKVFFGSTSSPFLLQVVLKHLFSTFKGTKLEHTANECSKNTYVDDLIASVDTVKDAKQLKDEATEIFKEGGFDLRKLKSNRPEVMEGEMLDEDIILGVKWIPKTDEFVPGVSFSMDLNGMITKRRVVSLLGKLYDPYGLLSPLAVGLKLLVQDMWLEKIPWDKPLEQKYIIRLEEISKSWNGAKDIKVKRWIGDKKKNNIMVYSDASEKAYSASVYLVTEQSSHLMCSKSRLCSPKGMTIPKLELLGALIASRLGHTVSKELGLDPKQVIYFTDSLITLKWIQSDHRRWQIFVLNRVKEIQENQGIWKFCPGSENPADLATRPSKVNDLNELWFQGPKWMVRGEFPNLPEDNEVKYEANAYLAVASKENEVLMGLISPSRCGTWMKFIRSWVYVLRFCKISKLSGDIEVQELDAVRDLVFSHIQKSLFAEELCALKDGKPVSRSSKLVNFDPFLDAKGLIRIGGRLHNAQLEFDEKHPIILGRCKSVDLLIEHYHRKNAEAGSSVILTLLRKDGIWLLKSKKYITSVIKKCWKCKRFRAIRCEEKAPPFPVERVKQGKPFSVTGVDLGGYLILKDGKKCWFILFTCMKIRAVHIELLTSLSFEATYNGFQRFISRRCTPDIIMSDHGTNFVATRKHFIQEGFPIKWKFVVERGSWWGGAWERLIGVTKNLLKRSIGKSVLDYDQMQTTLANIERVINLRPITYQWESRDGGNIIPVPIRPEMFLSPIGGLPENTEITTEDLCQEIVRRSECGSKLLQDWERYYLLEVLGNSGKVWKKEKQRDLCVGDVVLIENENHNRLNWKLGIVVNLFGRAVELKTSDGKLLKRPIQRLYNMEISLPSNHDKNLNNCLIGNTCQDDQWIACDNPLKCPAGEWFHFKCVGIREAPKEKWFCPTCTTMNKN